MNDPLQNAKKKMSNQKSKMATKYNTSPSGKNILKLFLFETCEQYDIQLTGMFLDDLWPTVSFFWNSETCLNRTYLGPTFVFRIDRVFIQIKLIKISYFGTLFIVRFIQQLVLSGVSLYKEIQDGSYRKTTFYHLLGKWNYNFLAIPPHCLT